MDPSIGDFDQGLFCTEASWQNCVKSAGDEGATVCSTTPSTVCCLLASSTSESRTGSVFGASSLYVSKSFHLIALCHASFCSMWINGFLSSFSRLENVDGEVLNYLLEFTNWSTLSLHLKHILDQRQAEKSWQASPQIGTVTKYVLLRFIHL